LENSSEILQFAAMHKEPLSEEGGDLYEVILIVLAQVAKDFTNN
jgi:hypothetical protein